MTTTTREFDYKTSDRGLGYGAPHKMGRALWAPMFLMGLMGFLVGVILSWVRAAEIGSSSPDADTIATLGQLVPAFMFIGFLSVFAAISFAIARILGAFRKGGGEVQEAAGGPVETLRMPLTAKIFMLFMAMGMMLILLMVILHFVAAANASSWSAESLETWSVALEGFRRLGVAMYLFGITFGLGTIIHVLRFQSVRIRQLGAEPAGS